MAHDPPKLAVLLQKNITAASGASRHSHSAGEDWNMSSEGREPTWVTVTAAACSSLNFDEG